MTRVVRRRIYKRLVILTVIAMVTWLTSVLLSGSLLELDMEKFGPSLQHVNLRDRLCSKTTQSEQNPSVKKGLDFRNFTRLNFLDNFKNPCFLQNISTNTSDNLKSPNLARLRCVPYFLVAGFPKAGTTDLWFRLLNHPDIVARHVKEPMFFNKGKYNHATFAAAADGYIDFYSNATLQLQRLISPAQCQGPFPYHHGITGEASVDTAHDVPGWSELPGNENCVEPVVTNAEFAHRINPNLKVIFVVRNPTDRLYSDYIYESRFVDYSPSGRDFHRSAVAEVRKFRNCTDHHTLRYCAYTGARDTIKIRLRVGLYHIFIDDWLRVFGPNNVLIVNSDSTQGPRKLHTYTEILKFLQIRPFTQQEEAGIFQRGPINTRSKPEKDLGDMLNETRTLLDEFYKPFNEKLFKMNVL